MNLTSLLGTETHPQNGSSSGAADFHSDFVMG